MINLSHDSSVWLVPESCLGVEIESACALAYQLYKKHHVAGDRGSSFSRIKNATNSGAFNFKGWSAAQADRMIAALFWKSTAKWHDVHPDWDFPKSYNAAFSNFLRVVCIVLWARRIFLAPLNLMACSKVDKVLDDLCIEFMDVKPLAQIRSLHNGSDLSGVRYDYNDQGRRAGLWFRLLLSTTLYSELDASLDDIKVLYSASVGEGKLPLRTYDVSGFLKTLFEEGSVVFGYLGILEGRKEVQIEIKAEEAKERKAQRDKQRYRSRALNRDGAPASYLSSIKACVGYARGESAITINELVKHHFTSVRYAKIFRLDSDFYKGAWRVVVDLSVIFSDQFDAFLISSRYENESNHRTNQNILRSYIGVYLPNFFIARDGSLEAYPRTLSDFSGFLYVTWDQQGTEKSFNFIKKPPMTLLAYLKLHVELHELEVDTHYQKVKSFELFLGYIKEHKEYIEGAEFFSINFTPSCYPKLARSYTTSKKALPRKYFSAFVSMLYSFECLVEHLNDVASGTANVVKEGDLVEVTLWQLQNEPWLAGVWGKRPYSRGVDLSVLSYCPIFYSDDKIIRLEYVPRFYLLADYELEGRVVERVVPNDVRITQVMCETGLRQAHVIWLDLDNYDRNVQVDSESPLISLEVATDKAHGAWTAIVARHLLGILKRQRDWYKLCTSQDFEAGLHYKGNKSSKFGCFRPLFRRYGVSHMAWYNYSRFPIYLLALKYYIERQAMDSSDYELVYLRSDDGSLNNFENYSKDYSVNYSFRDLVSQYTPHGLRAAFITEATNFLPPSIVGQYFTGQTPELVLYYRIVDGLEVPGHQKILADYLSGNVKKFTDEGVTEVSSRIHEVNSMLADGVKSNPAQAVKKFGLISLQGVIEGKNGLDVLLAEKFTRLAFNLTHICPFGNKCPEEVIKNYGHSQPCGACPYAVRGVMHLPAVSAEKDKYKEMMVAVLKKIKESDQKGLGNKSPQEMENLYAQHDFYAREAYTYEAVEQQLYKMHERGEDGSFMVTAKDELLGHFKRVKLSEAEHLAKRLIDAVSAVDSSSPGLDVSFAYLRARLLMHDGKLEDALSLGEGTPAHQLCSVIRSMVDSKCLDVMDLVRFASEPITLPAMDQRPIPLIDINE